jgi:hypothetical protein
MTASDREGHGTTATDAVGSALGLNTERRPKKTVVPFVEVIAFVPSFRDPGAPSTKIARSPRECTRSEPAFFAIVHSSKGTY